LNFSYSKENYKIILGREGLTFSRGRVFHANDFFNPQNPGFYDGDSIWHKYEKIFTSNYILDDNNYGRINAADVYSYAQAYNLMDIGLIPLRYNEFNRAKSELKMLEMGAFGLGVIVSDVESYQWMSKHGKNCLVAGKKDWYKSMRRLIENPELRKDLGSQLKEDVMQNSNEALWRKYRMEYYESIISSK